jgi:hypothetical protein
VHASGASTSSGEVASSRSGGTAPRPGTPSPEINDLCSPFAPRVTARFQRRTLEGAAGSWATSTQAYSPDIPRSSCPYLEPSAAIARDHSIIARRGAARSRAGHPYSLPTFTRRSRSAPQTAGRGALLHPIRRNAARPGRRGVASFTRSAVVGPTDTRAGAGDRCRRRFVPRAASVATA